MFYCSMLVCRHFINHSVCSLYAFLLPSQLTKISIMQIHTRFQAAKRLSLDLFELVLLWFFPKLPPVMKQQAATIYCASVVAWLVCTVLLSPCGIILCRVLVPLCSCVVAVKLGEPVCLSPLEIWCPAFTSKAKQTKATVPPPRV